MALLYGPDSSKVISDHLKLPYLKSQNLLPKLSENLQLCPKIYLSKRDSGDERHSEEIRRWFALLSQAERESALSLQNPVLVSLLIQMHLKRLKSGEIEVALIDKLKSDGKTELTDYFYVRNKNTLSHAYEDVLRLTDSEEYLDTLTIDSSYTADPNKFFDLMKSVSQNRAFSAPCREVKVNHKRVVYEYPVWICPSPNTFNTLLEWACAALEQSLWISYWNRHRNAQKSLGYAQLLPSVQAYWNNLSSERKRTVFDNINIREIQAKLQRFEVYRMNANPAIFNQIASASRSLNSLRGKVIMNQSDACVELLQHKVRESSFVYDLVNPSFARSYSLLDFVARTVFFRIVKAKEEEELEKLLSEVHIEPSQTPKKKKKKRKVIIKVEIKKEVVPLKASPKPEKPNIQFESTDSEDFQLVSKKKRDRKPILPLGAVINNLTPDKPSKKQQKFFKTHSSDSSSKSGLNSKSSFNSKTGSDLKPASSRVGFNWKSDSVLKSKLSTMAGLDSSSEPKANLKTSSGSRSSLNSLSVSQADLKTSSESISSLNSLSVSQADLKTGSGSRSNLNSVTGSQGNLKSDTAQGDLKSDTAQGNLKSDTAQGNLKSDTAQGHLKSDTAQGNLKSDTAQSNLKSGTRSQSSLSSASQGNLASASGPDSQSNLTPGDSDSTNSNRGQDSDSSFKANSTAIDSKPNFNSNGSFNSNLHSEATPFSSLHEEIVEFYEQVSLKRTRKLEAIQILVRSLCVLINSVFPSSEIRIFGSYASGLALETSDVDLQVLNVCFSSRVIIQQVCVQLGTLLKAYSCVVGVNIIPQATVPVIKLEVDLHGFDPFQKDSINVDLSFGNTPESHGGLNSLRASEEYLSSYPSLAYITIVLKAILIAKNLNNTYLGGINSYSLLLWIVAFYKHCNGDFKDYGELLRAVLQFYGHQFNYKTQAIDPKAKDGFSPKPESAYATTIDPINDTNDTTRTGFRIQCVLDEFADAYKRVQEGGLKKLF